MNYIIKVAFCNYLNTFYFAFIDGESDIHDVQFLHHHWEQPYNECTGLDCRYCLRGPSERITFSSQCSESGLTTIHTMPNNIGDGYFRFRIENTVMRKYPMNYQLIVS